MSNEERLSITVQLPEGAISGDVLDGGTMRVSQTDTGRLRWKDSAPDGFLTLTLLASTEPEQPASEGEDLTCEYCQTKMLVTRADIGDEYTMALCPNLLCPGLEPSTTEGEREKALYSTTLLRARDAKACCSKCSEAWTSAIAELERMSLALLTQPKEPAGGDGG